jgi:hypothetical protein
LIALRVLSLAAGGLVLVVPPMLMFDAGAGNMSGKMVAGGLIGMALIALSFFYIAMAGRQMRRDVRARMLGGFLLLIPAAASLGVLATGKNPAMLGGGGALLVFTILLFLSFVLPATASHRQRPMRQRERHEATVLQLHRR